MIVSPGRRAPALESVGVLSARLSCPRGNGIVKILSCGFWRLLRMGGEDAFGVEDRRAAMKAEDHIEVLVGDRDHGLLAGRTRVSARFVLLGEESFSTHQR